MHILTKAALAATAIAGAAALGGCTDRGYGYTGVSVGYSAGYGDPYWGWYDDYYYPGTGYYVYDQYRRPYRWTSTQQRYWTDRQRAYSNRTRSRATTSNWSDFARATANIARENRRTRRD